jgi:hypothetical protein
MFNPINKVVMIMKEKNNSRLFVGGVLLVSFFVISFFILFNSGFIQRTVLNYQTEKETIKHEQENFTRSDSVPELPFPDNPDPDQCGIPIDWGDNNQAWLTGYYQGELIEPIVHLYDSHLRLEVTAQAAHGTEVEVILFQANPVLNYYLVRIKSLEGESSQGWVPAPLLSFEPVQGGGQ